MRYYNVKTRTVYDSPRIAIVGDVAFGVDMVVSAGFFREMVFVWTDGTVPRDKVFIVSKTVPVGWEGETISPGKFAELINAYRINVGILANGKSVSELPNMEPPPYFPSFFAQIKNLASTLTDFARDGFRLSDENEWRRRFDVCKKCDRFFNNRCSACGCYTELKSKINAAQCPFDKWKDTQK